MSANQLENPASDPVFFICSLESKCRGPQCPSYQA